MLPVVYGFNGLVVTSYVGAQGVPQTADELVVLDALLLNEWLDTLMEVSLVPMAVVVTSVHVLGEMANRSMSPF